MSRRIQAGTVLGIAALAGVVYLAVHPGRQAGPSRTGAQANASPQQCAGCHRGIWETYRRTGMARSFYRPSPANTIEDYAKKNTFFHQASGSYFTMLVRGGKYFQRRYQLGPDAKETNVMEKEIHYVLGSGNHVRTYLNRTSRNTLVELPLAWYAEKGGYWAMNPGYDRPDHPGFSRQVTYDCMFCHNGYPQVPAANVEPGAEPVFSASLPEGVDCQRCHGPGGKHVQLAGSGAAKPQEIRDAIVNPARLSPERQMEVCMQCHLETTSTRLPNSIQRYERGPFSYKPGEPLSEFMLFFDHAPGSGHDDKFEIVSSAYRLRRSACFEKSGGALRCTTCHNPHDIPRGEQAARHYAEVCRQCHAAAFDQLVSSGKHARSGDCVGCHMPKRRTDDVVHAVMTDHYIQRRKPSRDLLAEIAERRETDANAYRGEVVLYYPRQLPKTPENELYAAIAQVSQKSNLNRGVAQLAAAIDAYRPERAEYYLQLAEAWRNSGQLEKALPLYEEAIRRKPRFSIALRKLGAAQRYSGQPGRAAETLKRALDVDPDDATAWHELGLANLDQGRKPDAIAALERAVALQPNMAEAHNNLGGVWFESGDRTRAEAAFREAIRIQPDYAEAHNNLGNLLSSAGDFSGASEHFETALRLQPNYSAARYNYAAALTRVRRFDDAQRQLESTLRADPGVAEAHELLGNLLARKGQAPGAIAHYREALKIRPGFDRASLSLGVALASLGDSAEALSQLRKAAASSDPAVREEAGQLLQQLGNR